MNKDPNVPELESLRESVSDMYRSRCQDDRGRCGQGGAAWLLVATPINTNGLSVEASR